MAKKIFEKQNDSTNLAKIYLNIGSSSSNPVDELFYIKKGLQIAENINNTDIIIKSSNNLASIYLSKKEYDKALQLQKKVLELNKKLGAKDVVIACLINIGISYYYQNKINEAENNFKQAEILSKEINHKEFMKLCYEDLSQILETKGDFKQALHYQKLFTAIKDTLFNTESSKQITEMNTKYETELKDKELLKKDAEIAIQQANSEKQTIVRNGFIVGFVFLLGLIIFIYRGYAQKQKTNKLLNDKNQKITDSINYAKLIQSSILPTLEEIQKYLPQTFVFYQPKDIVSGDFYWLYPINNQTVIVAVVDCTGHGVPGAMMSMLGYSLLEQVVNQNKTTTPAEILDQLNFLVIESLKQSDSVDNIKNGMDMALFKLDYNTYELEYAGAKNPLYIVRDQQLIELKADRKSIGLSTGNTSPFNNQLIKLHVGDQLFAFSDGYIDQKGGAENKKFYSANFQKLLISINALNTNEQEEHVKNAFNSWKASKEQIDDVLVFGIKV